MYYICIEQDKVVGILNYEPSVPDSISVVTITDAEYDMLSSGSHYFDVTSRNIIPQNPSIISAKEQEKSNAAEREFLNSTDWIVLRHIRQKYLEIDTSLSEEEYQNLEMQRQQAASRIS